MSLLVDRLGYVALGTPDLDTSVDFFVSICQLEVSERRDDVVFLRGGLDHHWLRLERRDRPGVIRAGFQATDAESAEEIRRRLAERGIDVRPGGTLKEDRVVEAFRFEDPNGIEVEIFGEMVQMPRPPAPTGVNIEMLVHAVYAVRDVEATRNFWRDVLDFRRSDQIEDVMVFMRSGNQYHHAMGFMKDEARAGALDHICMLVSDLDDIAMMVNAGKRSGLPMAHDIVRHAASGAISTYVDYEPLSLGVEYCVGHSQVDEDYPGRLLIASPETVNLWHATPSRAIEHSVSEAAVAGSRGVPVT